MRVYDLIFSDTALQQLKKLERQVQERVIKALERIRIRPESYVQKLVGDRAYKLRVGDYRVLMDIDLGKLQILIIKIGHRKNVYDKIR